MRAWDSLIQGGAPRPGPAALVILLIGLLLSLAPVSQRIEGGYFDLLQRIHEHTGSDQILLVDTLDIEPSSGSVWDSDRFPDVLTALRDAGARAVIAMHAPPPAAALPDSLQLATLAELERRRRESTDAQGTSGASEAFGRELEEMRRRSQLQARTVEAVAGMSNLIVAVPTFDGARVAQFSGGDCLKHVVAKAADTESALTEARRVRAIVPTPRHLCDVVAGAGHVEFWPDADGVVRRAELLLNAAGVIVPSAALRAAIGADVTQPPTIGENVITWDSHTISTTGGPATLLHFYSGEPPFERISAGELLGAPAPRARISGRTVILGHTQAAEDSPGYVTPMGDQVPGAELLATTLSNVLEQDYLLRPAWLAVAESALLVLLGVTVLAWGARLPASLSLMFGVLSAALLLAVEAFLLYQSQLWSQLATAAAFTTLATGSIPFLQPWAGRRQPQPTPASEAGAGPRAHAAPVAVAAEDELDLAFSMLRHQPPSDNVKQRLYDVALEHARRKDLAKAERVLRHLAGIDPHFRGAGEKLKKLAGLRTALPATAAPPGTAPPAPAAAQTGRKSVNLTGTTIGRYEIEQAIGKGAMATVYLGRDPKINRRVAIKTIALAEEFNDTDLVNARTQFLREAESAGRLNHPNIISIYDAGEDGAVAYLAMEYFPGKPLSFHAQPNKLLPARSVFELMARAAEALHYAHGQHVVHRDVKPANLLYDSSTDTLKITDFGIARLTDTSRTKTGIILGTPSYMSPEQLAGTNVTGQSDLFSLGVTTYQLLTGVPPFRADSIPRLMQKIAHEPHEPVRRIRADLPPGIDEILDRALAKSPGDRYPSGRAMALALRDCCSSFAA